MCTPLRTGMVVSRGRAPELALLRQIRLRGSSKWRDRSAAIRIAGSGALVLSAALAAPAADGWRAASGRCDRRRRLPADESSVA